MDGAGPFSMFFFIILPHLGRAISVVIMIETIFLLTVFAEIFVTTAGGPGNATTNLAFLIYARALLQFDVGGASAGGVVAIILAALSAVVQLLLVPAQPWWSLIVIAIDVLVIYALTAHGKELREK